MAKYIKVKQNGGPSVKMVVCEVCGKKYKKFTSANACEARHFFNCEKPTREANNAKK